MNWRCEEYADTPMAWFARLKDEGTTAVRLHHFRLDDNRVADRMSVGFIGGGGRWLIETERPSGCDVWENRWELGDRERADRRIWGVTYGRLPNCAIPAGVVNPMDELKRRLKNNLSQIAAFARDQELDSFAKSFESGLARLEAQAPFEGLYHADIAPPGFLSLAAEQFLATAQAAWVFGGMGSWNDLSFSSDAQAKYDSLSGELFELLQEAVVVAVNSSVPPREVPARTPWWRFW